MEPHHQAIQDGLKRLGIDYVVRDKASSGRCKNPHNLSAAIRELECVNALNALYKEGCRKVLSLYGNVRETKIVKWLNKNLPDGLDLTGKPYKMTVVLHRPRLVPKDSTRASGMDTLPDLFPYDGFYMNDIYMVENGVPINPLWLRQFSQFGPIAWSGHVFLGAAGAIEGEGAWIRRDTCIYHKADEEEGTEWYPPHEDANWLCYSGQDDETQLHWSVSTTTSDTRTVLIRKGYLPGMRRAPPPPTQGVEWLDLPLPPDDSEFAMWLGSKRLFGTQLAEWRLLRPLFPMRRLYIHRRTYAVACRFISGKARTNYTLSALDQKVKAELEGDPEITLIRAAFPHDFVRLQFNTLLAAFIHGVKEERDAWRSVRRVQGAMLAELKEHRSKVDTEDIAPAPWYVRHWYLWVAAAAAIALLRRKNPPMGLSVEEGYRWMFHPVEYFDSVRAWLGSDPWRFASPYTIADRMIGAFQSIGHSASDLMQDSVINGAEFIGERALPATRNLIARVSNSLHQATVESPRYYYRNRHRVQQNWDEVAHTPFTLAELWTKVKSTPVQWWRWLQWTFAVYAAKHGLNIHIWFLRLVLKVRQARERLAKMLLGARMGMLIEAPGWKAFYNETSVHDQPTMIQKALALGKQGRIVWAEWWKKLPAGWSTNWFPFGALPFTEKWRELANRDQCSTVNWLTQELGLNPLQSAEQCPNFFWAVLLGPLSEEALKHFFPSCFWAIPAFEALKHLFSIGPSGLAFYGCTAALMHGATAMMGRRGLPLWSRMLVHAAWNGLVWAIHRRSNHSFPTLPTGCVVGALVDLWRSIKGKQKSGEHPHAPINDSQPWEEFRGTFHDAPWSERLLEPASEARASKYQLERGLVPRPTHACYDLKPVCELLECKRRGDWILAGVYPDGEVWRYVPAEAMAPRAAKRYVLWWLPTNVPGYAADRSPGQLWAVVESRILAEPPLAPRIQLKAWRSVHPLLTERNAPITEIADILREWLDHITDVPKRRKLEKAFHEVKENGYSIDHIDFNQTSIEVKTDEITFKTRVEVLSSGETLVWVQQKPRAIANIAPRAQAATGPYIYAATKRLKARWCSPWNMEAYWRTMHDFEACDEVLGEQPYTCGKWKVWVTYAGAMNAYDLSLWMAAVVNRIHPQVTAYVMVSGDDSLVAVWNGETWDWYEGDATMYDQSESLGPLLSEYAALRALGVPENVITVLYQLAHARYMVRGDGWTLTIDRSERPMRDTGGADTSAGNSIVMGQSWCHVLTHNLNFDKFAELGLNMKMKRLSSPYDVTFLKGMWYHTDYFDQLTGLVLHHWWGPLPSRILKVGKCLRDPRTLYREHRKDLKAATQAFAGDLALSYLPYLQVPVLRAFVRRFRPVVQGPHGPRLAELGDQRRSDVDEKGPWKVHGWQGPYDAVDWDNVYRRYNTSPEEVMEVEEMISMAEVGTFLEHPLFRKLAEVDYF